MAEWISDARRAGLAAIGAGLLAFGGMPAALAQQKPPAGKSAAKSAPAPAQQQSAWVKLCEKAPYQKIGADGKPQIGADKKPVMEERELCITHHEQMTPTGETLLSAAVQQLQGVEKLHMMIMVPPAVGIVIPAGMRVYVYSKEQLDKLQKKEQVDESQVAFQDLAFTMCHQNGCTAENEATPQLLKAMREGAGMMALVRHPSGRMVPFQMPLVGFSTTIAGKPVNNDEYKKQRGMLWDQIRANQLEHLKKVQQQLANPQQAAGAGGPPAKAPAKK
jgi:invasion protein IalB